VRGAAALAIDMGSTWDDELDCLGTTASIPLPLPPPPPRARPSSLALDSDSELSEQDPAQTTTMMSTTPLTLPSCLAPSPPPPPSSPPPAAGASYTTKVPFVGSPTPPGWVQTALAEEQQILEAEQCALPPPPGGVSLGDAALVTANPTTGPSLFIFNAHRHRQDDTTPWLLFTEWPRFFHRRSLLGLIRAAGMPDTP
jgi:hypothetical protein